MQPPYRHHRLLQLPIIFLHTLFLGLGMAPADAGTQVVAWGAGKTSDGGQYNYGQSEIPANLTNAVMVAGGRTHSLALKADGTLLGWGNDQIQQIDLPAESNYVSISCGYLFSAGLLSNGTVVATGDTDTHGETDVPANLSNVVAVACGWYHCLALKNDGTVVSWGTSTNPADWYGLDTVSYGQCVVPAGLSNVVAVAGGGYHSLALKSDGTVVAWGAGKTVNINNSVDRGQAIVPVGLSNVVAIAAGEAHSLALDSNGRVVVWGDNTYGQTNVPASLTNGVAAIAAGAWHNLVLLTNGTVVAWGAGVGSISYVDFGQNVVPSGLTNVIQIAGGVYNSLAVVGSGPPRIRVPLTIASMGTNGFAIGSSTRNGRAYRLEYKNDLTNQVWSAFPLQAGLGATNWFKDPNLLTSHRFYRVSQW